MWNWRLISPFLEDVRGPTYTFHRGNEQTKMMSDLGPVRKPWRQFFHVSVWLMWIWTIKGASKFQGSKVGKPNIGRCTESARQKHQLHPGQRAIVTPRKYSLEGQQKFPVLKVTSGSSTAGNISNHLNYRMIIRVYQGSMWNNWSFTKRTNSGCLVFGNPHVFGPCRCSSFFVGKLNAINLRSIWGWFIPPFWMSIWSTCACFFLQTDW